MKNELRLAIGAGALLVGYLMLRKKPDGGASISIGVDKTSGECAPGGSKAGTADCSASDADGPIDAVAGALGDAADTIKDALGGLLGGGKGASSTDDTKIPTYEPMPTKTSDGGARFTQTTDGSDGPRTRPLPILTGAGSKLDERIASSSSKANHR